MLLSEGMDEGDMLLERRLTIDPSDTGGTLTRRLATVGAQTAVDGLRLAKSEGLTVTPQDAAQATYARLLEKKDGQLDFSQTAVEIDRRVRAFDPWPGTFVAQTGGPLKVRRASVFDAPDTLVPARDHHAGPGTGLAPRWSRNGTGPRWSRNGTGPAGRRRSA